MHAPDCSFSKNSRVVLCAHLPTSPLQPLPTLQDSDYHANNALWAYDLKTSEACRSPACLGAYITSGTACGVWPQQVIEWSCLQATWHAVVSVMPPLCADCSFCTFPLQTRWSACSPCSLMLR